MGAGELDHDPQTETEFRDRLRAGCDAADDAAWEARLAGARRAVEEAEAERDRYGTENFPALADEMAAGDEDARDGLQHAYEELAAAEDAYALRTRRWHRLAAYGGLPPESVPPLPTHGDPTEVAARFARGIPAPTPTPLLDPAEEK